MSLKIHASIPPKEEEILTIIKGLQTFDMKTISQLEDSVNEFGFFLYENDIVMGGITGRTFLGALQIKYLWLSEKVRGKGFGRKLISQAEEFGKRFGCRFSITDTMSFQSIGFYKRAGYSIELAQKGYDNGEVAYYLRKQLS